MLKNLNSFLQLQEGIDLKHFKVGGSINMASVKKRFNNIYGASYTMH